VSVREFAVCSCGDVSCPGPCTHAGCVCVGEHKSPKCPFCDWNVEDHDEDAPHRTVLVALAEAERNIGMLKAIREAYEEALKEIRDMAYRRQSWEPFERAVNAAFLSTHKLREALADGKGGT
jgi:hypothetical protein